MPEGTCDPASVGRTYWEVTQAQGPNGEVEFTYRHGWDGTSQRPECNGPIVYVKAFNNGSVTHYGHFLGRKGTPRTIACAPGQTIEEDRPNVLRNMGLETVDDVAGMYITTSPNPPPTLLKR